MLSSSNCHSLNTTSQTFQLIFKITSNTSALLSDQSAKPGNKQPHFHLLNPFNTTSSLVDGQFLLDALATAPGHQRLPRWPRHSNYHGEESRAPFFDVRGANFHRLQELRSSHRIRSNYVVSKATYKPQCRSDPREFKQKQWEENNKVGA